MTTLADLTPSEREECVGMWVYVEHPKGEFLAILRGTRTMVGETIADVYCPTNGEEMWAYLNEVTPWFGKIRAWRPDGTPPTGRWEYDHTDENGHPLSSTDELPDIDPHEHIRRWIGEWEPA